jgi:6-phosphogluconate dehydrogenase
LHSMQIGLIGLGKMGSGMAQRLLKGGIDVVGFDANEQARELAQDAGISTVPTLDALAASLDAPRSFWVMVPPGEITTTVITSLAALAQPGDLVVDGGNSDFRDAPARRDAMEAAGGRFADVGVSGGQWGWKTGYGLMVGSTEEDFSRLEPVLTALSSDGGFTRVGGVGAGHFVKAIHNGVQYGIMQAYAEGFAMLSAHDEIDVLAGMRAWQNGSSVRSWLLENIIQALQENPTLDSVPIAVPDSGMGRWTAEEAVRLGVATPVLTAALFERFASRDEEGLAHRLLVASRTQIGGHA